MLSHISSPFEPTFATFLQQITQLCLALESYKERLNEV
jgi:hypothetical protein